MEKTEIKLERRGCFFFFFIVIESNNVHISGWIASHFLSTNGVFEKSFSAGYFIVLVPLVTLSMSGFIIVWYIATSRYGALER